MVRIWFERWKDGAEREVDPVPDAAHLHPVSEARLEALVPDPPLDSQRAALHAVRGGHGRALLIRPDDGSWDVALDEEDVMGPDRPAPPKEPPWQAGLPGALRERLADPAPLHVPRLERWYVRHHDGLTVLRALLAGLGAREGRWTADVAPWAWGWMRHVLPESRALPAPHAVAPLDGEALARWFEPVGDVRVRSQQGGPPDRTIFDALAARSRGSAGVAAAIWRACLRDGAERARDADGGDDEARADQEPGVVWMRHPMSVELPNTASMGREDLMMLHAILMHGGATTRTLRRAVSSSPGASEASVAAAEARDLLEVDGDGRHRIRPVALPAVRDRLRSEAFAPEIA